MSPLFEIQNEFSWFIADILEIRVLIWVSNGYDKNLRN